MLGTETAAIDYARRGWRVVILHAPTLDGGCTCGKPECQSQGKHPIEGAWQRGATTDPKKIHKAFMSRPYANLGVALGKESGIIDIECDTPQAETRAQELGLSVRTPTFAAGRGKHRLFRWQDGLPEQAKLDVEGIEFRLGGGGKGAQSVFPPSQHKSGASYRWEISPETCDPATLPDCVVEMLSRAAAETKDGEGAGAPVEFGEILKGVEEGGRNDAAASLIGSLLVGSALTANQINAFWTTVTLWNQQNRPPMSERELRTVFESILRRERDRQASAGFVAEAPRPTAPVVAAVVAEAVAPKDAEEKDGAKTGEALRRLRDELGIPLATIIKRGQTNSTYYLRFDDGQEVAAGDAGALLSIQTLRAVIFDATGYVIPNVKAKDWQQLCRCMAQIAVTVEMEELDPAAVLSEWVAARVIDCCMPPEAKDAAIKDGSPWRDSAGNIYINAGDLCRWINAAGIGEKVTTRRVALQMHKDGWTRITLESEGAKRYQKRYWVKK